MNPKNCCTLFLFLLLNDFFVIPSFGYLYSNYQYQPNDDSKQTQSNKRVTTVTPGSTPISPAVTHSGAFQATIPFWLPQGPSSFPISMGMQYSSQSSNGLFGAGWTLTGFSTINRCMKTLSFDQKVQEVLFDASDAICLDGDRLGLQSGNEYRPEHSPHDKVLSYSSAGAGPGYFKLTDREGKEFSYGSTSDSAVKASGRAEIQYWLLDQMKDQAGNYVKFRYSKNEATTEYYPLSVELYGNTAGTTPNFSVNFTYISRNDPVIGYTAGSVGMVTKLLSTVTVNFGQQLLRKYTFNYVYSPVTQRAVLASLYECTLDLCYQPLVMNYQFVTSTSFTFNSPGSGIWNGHSGTGTNNFLGDFNGDGKTDNMGYAGNGEWNVCLSTGSSFVCSFWTGHSGGETNNIMGDFNGDGKTDIAAFLGSGQWDVRLSSGSNFNLAGSGTWTGHNGGNTNCLVGDFNGDGRTDIAGYTGSNGIWHVTLSSGTNFNAANSGMWNALYPSDEKNTITGDFNGDGMTDLATANATGFTVSLSSGTSFNAPGGNFWGGHGGGLANNVVADFNGDGKSDVAGYTGSNGIWHVTLSTGRAFSGQGSGFWLGHTGGVADNTVGDFNGDGRADMAGYTGSNGIWHVTLSTGSNFTAPGSGMWPGHSGGPTNNFVGDFNGDGKSDLMGNAGSGQWHVTMPGGVFPDLLTAFRDGHNHTYIIEYNALTNNTYYTKGTDSVYPRMDFQGPMYAVTKLQIPSTTFGTATPYYDKTYQYRNCVLNLRGRGYRGCQIIQETDTTRGTITSWSYSLSHVSAGLLENETITTTDSVPKTVKTVVNTIDTVTVYPNSYRSYVNYSVEKNWEPDGSFALQRTVQTVQDTYGNTVTEITQSDDGIKVTKNLGYYVNTNLNILGKLNSVTTVNEAPGKTPKTKTWTAQYNSIGQMIREDIEPSSPSLHEYRQYQYDSFGNVVQMKVNSELGNNLTKSSTYDSRGRFLVQQVNEMGHVESFTFDQATGTLTSKTDSSNIITSYTWDSFGRKLSQSAGGITAQVTYIMCTPGTCQPTSLNPVQPSFIVRTKSVAAAGTILSSDSYYFNDQLVLKEVSPGFDGRNVIKETVYNRRGLKKFETQKYNQGDTPSYFTFSYDYQDRVVSVVLPDNTTTFVTYTGRKKITTDASMRNRTEVHDSSGKITQITDAAGSVYFEYDALGNLEKVTDVGGAVSTFQWDIRGRKTQISPANGQTVSTQYDPLGNTISVSFADGTVVYYEHDALGRMTSRTFGGQTDTWEWDKSPSAVGKLSKSISSDGVVKTFEYDQLGRVVRENMTLNGTTNSISRIYDSFGRQLKIATEVMTERYEYNRFGFLSAIVDDATNKPIWNITSQSASGEVLTSKYGNGVTTQRSFDLNGKVLQIQSKLGVQNLQQLQYSYDPKTYNLLTSVDAIANLAQDYSYDNLDRLVTTNFFNGGSLQRTQSLQYAPNGNILFKSDVGTFVYGDPYLPHAVTSITGAAGTLANYLYDGRGNRISGPSETIDYTWFNKPQSLKVSVTGECPPLTTTTGTTASSSAGGTTGSSSTGTSSSSGQTSSDDQQVSSASVLAPALILGLYGMFGVASAQASPQCEHKTLFSYDANQNLAQQQYFQNGETAGYKISFGLLEITYEPDGTKLSRHFVQGLKDTVAIVSKTNNGPKTVVYLHPDRLGSTNVVTASDGSVLKRYYFDPWGQELTNNTLEPVSYRGFTAHQHIPESSLISMGGRMYDARLARFLNADPLVQAPQFTQNFNSYSYGMNNPLSFTDPSGYSFLSHILGTAVSVFVGVVLTVVFPELGPAAFGFGFSFTNAILDGASVQDAIKSGIKGAVMAAITAELFDTSVMYKDLTLKSLEQAINHGFFVSGQEFARYEFGRLAKKIGVDPALLDATLFALSFVGNELVGSRYNNHMGKANNEWGIEGWANRGVIGLGFDVVDTVLAAQGIPTATSFEIMMSTKEARIVTEGHSLGSLDAANLKSYGLLADDGTTVKLIAFPIVSGIGSPGGTQVYGKSDDFVSGFWLVKLFHPVNSKLCAATPQKGPLDAHARDTYYNSGCV